jgi:DNA repair exonuclease SbcCD ATPase subunit
MPHCCAKCGFDLTLQLSDATQAALLDAQRQIKDLQAQVRLLNQKATAAVDRWADYEDELARLRAELQAQKTEKASAPAPPPPPSPPSTARSTLLPAAAAGRLSALLSPRKSTPNLQVAAAAGPAVGHRLHASQSAVPNPPLPLPSPGAVSTDDLLEALSREQALRVAAEGRLNDASREVEELSVQLFEQANEMVATERRARAKLEERVEVLERRDGEKRRRLERLESAMGRIERARALLAEVKTKTEEGEEEENKSAGDGNAVRIAQEGVD